jgi:diamine N-acetyltransferase
MISIRKADENDSAILATLGSITFRESHGHSAAPADIDAYDNRTFRDDILKNELRDAKNIYHIIYHNNKAVGFSKIILNLPYAGSDLKNITKLDRLYLLQEFYNLHLGSALFTFITDFMKEQDQMGVWLFTWKKNQRAIDFYERKGFKIIGSFDFKLSETHSNPNHQMVLHFNER